MKGKNDGNGNELNELFTLMEIDQVVCVDDQYASYSEDKVNDVIGFCSELGVEKVVDLSSHIPELENILFKDGERIWKKQLRQLWGSLDEDKRDEIYNLFDKDSTTDSANDIQSAGELSELMLSAPAIRFHELSLKQWKDREEEFLKDESAMKTLFLFDRDLSRKEDGFEHEGIKIIQKVLDRSDVATCGLFSHTFNSNDEVEEWEKISMEHEIDKNRFVLISKQRLNNENGDFLRSLKRAVLNKHCDELKKELVKIVNNTMKKSKKEIDNLNIYDFEHIVFRSSYNEGIWELDTLLRLHSLFQRDIVREEAIKHKDWNQLTNKIRSISLIPRKPDKSLTEGSWKIQRREIYEEGKHINKLHMPLELGDVFEKTTGGNKKYVLIAQPCDLMVRPDGKRKSTLVDGVLARIERPSDSWKKKILDGQSSLYRLPYFDETSGEEFFVNFNEFHIVKLCILDLCVFQQIGTAKYSSMQKCPDIIIPAWKKHFDHIIEYFQKVITRYSECEGAFNDKPTKQLKKGILQLVVPKSSTGEKSLFKEKIQINTKMQSISYDCRRISRICQPRSGEMLLKYSQHISRMAFSHDFLRENND